ncbi:MAG: PQQ-binding-like beta-propeller repeat protein [Planctomycetes bacterium]|nr:PQQ-binding-like beta-propeller repeat protein [Planctomycetota bacterium]
MRITLLTILLTASITFGADWPQWRGPDLNGVSGEKNLPATLDPNQTQLWKAPLPGPGEATPVVCGGRIYLSGYDATAKTLFALCIDAKTGKQIWNKTAAAFEKLPKRNIIAAPSPVADASGVVFLYSDGTLVKFAPDGAEMWKRDLAADYGPFKTGWSYSASPLLFDGRLYIAVMRYPGQDETALLDSYLLALDPATGKNIFKVDRPCNMAGTVADEPAKDAGDAYTSPLTTTINGKPQVVLYGGNVITAHDPATGSELWRYIYMDETMTWARAAATPVIEGDVIYYAFPGGRKVVACELSKLAAGDSSRLWTHSEHGSDIPSQVVVDGHLYLIQDGKKTLTCLDAATGTEKWTGQLDKSDTHYASITAGDDKLYMVNRKGTATIVAADPKEFRILSTRDLGENPTDSSIAIADGKLYIRTAQNLYCFGNK